MRLDKYISLALDISRTEAKTIIKNKQISVNNQVIISSNFEVSTNDLIQYQNEVITYLEKAYLLMNKPAGFVCATRDALPTVMDIIPTALFQKDLKILGRLDKDTEGLLIITNDGDFIHQITAPKKHIAKKYYVEYSGQLNDNASILIEKGLQLNEYQALPSKLEIIDEKSLYLTIYEGKFHQVKEMIAAVGGTVTYLKRLSIGKLTLGNLEVGSVRRLTKEELAQILEE